MAGVYFHIPFCRKACVYCNFHFSTKLVNKNEVLQAMLQELHLRKDYLKNQTVKTLYFGGGTPSVLSADEINSFVEKVNEYFDVDANAEVSLEANPDDLNLNYLKVLSQTGVNRLSIGVQSFREKDLLFMNRSHSVRQAIKCLENAKALGFENISIDLIYGLPGMSNIDWAEQLEFLNKFQIPHFSSYALTVEPKTALSHKIKSGKLAPLDEEKAAGHFRLLQNFAKNHGFEHYELSNFAKLNWRSKHNSSYWQDENYLGIGPSAHSFNGTYRHWNVSNNTLYLKSIAAKEVENEGEELLKQDRFNEMVMTRLRLIEGIDLKQVSLNFGEYFLRHILSEAKQALSRGRLRKDGNRLFIPSDWRFHSDGIASELFYI